MHTRKPFVDNGSFRDASGFVFYKGNQPYRAISKAYQENFDLLEASGLLRALQKAQLLVDHEIVPEAEEKSLSAAFENANIYRILRPDKIPFISYPYEWCFSQLKAAALLTLKIQQVALSHKMSLKDASAYNVQFIGTRPVFIDTLSFEPYKEGRPWVAYKQFCQHFLAPLLLIKYKSTELQKLMLIYIDGVPLSLTSKLLPSSSKLNPLVAMHIHMHARLESKYSDRGKQNLEKAFNLSNKKLTAILEHLRMGIEGIEIKSRKSEWVGYYDDFSYTKDAIEQKKRLVGEWVKKIQPASTWDIGCNTGMFSDITAENGKYTVAFDSDYVSVEEYYKKRSKRPGVNNVLPLVMDITNPSAGIGWANVERKTLQHRGPADLILALAVIHHLAISFSIPFEKVASYFSECTEWLIIEFVPKNDPQTQRLLVTREDVFKDYSSAAFKTAFLNCFEILDHQMVAGSERELFLMKKIK